MISPLVERFLEQVRQRPGQEAVVLGRRSLTYAGLAARMLVCSDHLRSRGVGVGDRVLLFVPPGPELYALLLATWRVGAVAVFVDAWTSRHRLGRVVALTSPRLFVGVPKAHLLRLLDAEVRRVPASLWWYGRGGSPDRRPPAEVSAESTALVTFTTGSTGAPKGADRSHRFLLAQHRTLLRTLATRPGSRDLATLPIFGLHDLAAGATCHLAPIDPARPDRFDVEAFNAQLRRSDTSAGSPAVYLSAARRMERPDPTIEARIHLGGAAVFPETIATLSKAYPNARWEAVYGSTEAEPIAVMDGQELAKWSGAFERGLPAGRPSPDISVRILSPCDGPLEASTERELDLLEVRPGEIGEIAVAGAHVLTRYWNDPEAELRHKIRTDERIWHRTGDAGRLDSDGRLYLHGRISERIQQGGRVHYPLDFERRLRSLEGVDAGCLVSRGETVVVAVQPLAGRDRAMLRARLEAMPWPFPVQIVLCAIPRDPRHRSKLDTALLRRRLGI